MIITSITWGSDISLFAEACDELGIELHAWSTNELKNDDAKLEQCIESFEHADVIILRPTSEGIWDEIIEKMNNDVPVISFGYDTSLWKLSNISLKIVATVSTYHVYSGLENIKNMFKWYIRL